MRLRELIGAACLALAFGGEAFAGTSVSKTVGAVTNGHPVVVDFGPQGEGGYPAAFVTRVSSPDVKLRLSYSTHPDGLGERGDFWHETRATYLGPDVWLPIAPANTDRFDVFTVAGAGRVRATKAQGLVRYVRIAVDTPGAVVDVEKVALDNDLVHSEEPVVGSFSCSDEDLTRIWQASVRTCLLASIPARGDKTLAYVSDGAKRDRLVWSGDLWWAQRNLYVAFGPASPYMPGSIDMLAENQTPGGYVNACPYPESRGPILREEYGPFGSDEFAAWFVPVLADHFLHTGDRAILDRRYPNVVRLMDYLAAHQGPDGLFEQRAETAKHSEGLQVGGTSLHHRTYMHLLLWRAYSDAARLAGWAERADDRKRFSAAADRLAVLLRTRFYSTEKKCFILSLEQPNGSAFTANAAALAFGFSTGAEARDILVQLSKHSHGKFQMMAIRGAFACRDGKKAAELLNAHNWRKAVRDDWKGTHLTSECMGLIRFGWGDEAHPDTALAGVLTEDVLGVRPLEPGYRTFTVDPIALPGVTWAKGRVPTPKGFIEVEWTLKGGRPDIRVTAPPGLVRAQGDYRPGSALRARLADERPDVIGIVHWGLNTYTDREWGFGDEDPKRLAPTAFDADQIVSGAREGGLGGLVVVAKHHDGFCLWPTKTTPHNITKATSFRNGKGDYVREMSEACRRVGLLFGVYCSPWDRNNAEYARPDYVKTYHAQVGELLDGRYGEIFEMWFDGANGGDGWYGGAKEKRKIEGDYYRFDRLLPEVRRLQPKACIFGMGGELSWPGNERGYVPDSEPGNGPELRLWEADFPLRKGWFYHVRDTNTVRCGEFLMQRYLGTVGRGGVMDIGLAPDRRGRLADEDVAALRRFGELRRAFFAHEVKDGGAFNLVVAHDRFGRKRITVTTDRAEPGRRYRVEDCLLNRVMNATTTHGETETAQWMTGKSSAEKAK